MSSTKTKIICSHSVGKKVEWLSPFAISPEALPVGSCQIMWEVLSVTGPQVVTAVGMLQGLQQELEDPVCVVLLEVHPQPLRILQLQIIALLLLRRQCYRPMPSSHLFQPLLCLLMVFWMWLTREAFISLLWSIICLHMMKMASSGMLLYDCTKVTTVDNVPKSLLCNGPT